MKALISKFPSMPETVDVVMSHDEARDLRDQMKEFWQLDGVHQNDEPTGDSPFAKIYKELSRVLGK